MANIAQELKVIAEGRYGKDVRKAIHDGMEKTNNESETSRETVATFDERVSALETEMDEVISKPTSAMLLESASPLEYATNNNISGLYVEGKSEQYISPNLINLNNFDWKTRSQGQSKAADITTNSITLYPSKANTFSQAYGFVKLEDLGLKVGDVFTCDCKFSPVIRTGQRPTIFIQLFETADVSTTPIVNAQKYIEDTNAIRVTVLDKAKYLLIVLRADQNVNATEGTYKIYDIIITKGSTALPYEPYTGTPTPTNPIPIVDASGVVEAHTINLIDGSKVVQGSFNTYDGSDFASTTRIRTDYIKVKPNTTYFINCNGCVIQNVASYGKGLSFIGFAPDNQFTTSESTQYVRIVFRYSDNSTITYNNSFKLMLTEGTTASEYVPYQSNSIDLADIGITLRSVNDIKNSLVVNEDGSGEWVRKIKVVDLGDYSYGYNAEQNYFYTSAQMTDKKVGSYAMLCNKYKIFNSTANMPEKTLTSGYSNNYIFVKNTDYGSDVNAIKTSMKGTILYYELATPIVHTLTKEQVDAIRQLKTYEGTTLIDTELQNVKIKYAGDTKKYVDDKFVYTSEEKFIGEFLGHPLYRKSYKTKTPITPNSIGLIVEDDFSDKKVVNLYGVYGGYSFQMPINRYDTSYTWVEYNGIKMHIAGGHTNYECYVTVEYFYEDYVYNGYIPEEEPQPAPLPFSLSLDDDAVVAMSEEAEDE